MRILILGLGFIATHIAQYFSSKAEVTVTYRNLNPVKKLYLETLESKGVRGVRLDPLVNTTELKELIWKSDVVVNCIGELSGSYEKLRLANFEVPKLIASLIKEKILRGIDRGKTILFHLSASTYGVVGDVKLEEPLGYGLNPTSEFERTKLEGERVVYNISKEGNFPAVILRPTLVYGKFASHIQFVNIYNLAKRGIVPLVRFSFQPISANYLAKLIDKVLEAGVKDSLYFYATECELIDLVRMIEIYAEALKVKRRIKIPVPKRLAIIALPKEVRSLVKYEGTRYDCNKTKEFLGSIKFDEEELKENALFLRGLDEKGILIPT